MRFLSYFWRHFNLLIWAGLRKTVYSLHYIRVCLLWDLSANWLVWFFLFADSTFPLPRITWTSWLIGILLSNRSLVARGCWPVHTPELGKLDCQSVCTYSWSEFNSSDLLLIVCECEWNKKRKKVTRERERERERERVLIYKICILTISRVQIHNPPHNLHLLFCCILSIFALIWLVHITLLI